MKGETMEIKSKEDLLEENKELLLKVQALTSRLEHYITKDREYFEKSIDFAVTYILQGLKLIRTGEQSNMVDPRGNNYAMFVFENTIELAMVRQKIHNGCLEVNISDFLNMRKELKNKFKYGVEE